MAFKINKMWLVVLVLALAPVCLQGCKQECHWVYPTEVDYEPEQANFGDQDADFIYIPPDIDYVDGDLDDEAGEAGEGKESGSDLDEEIIETEGEGDFDIDIDFEGGEVDLGEITPGAKVMPYDGRQIAEKTPLGAWEYLLKQESPLGDSISWARMTEELSATSELQYLNDGETVFGNPPMNSSHKQLSSSLSWSTYRLFDADGRVGSDFDDAFVLRREYDSSGTMEVDYWKVDLPSRNSDYTFHQVAPLPQQAESGLSSINIIVVWVEEKSDIDILLHPQSFRVNIVGDSVQLTPLTVELQISLETFTERTKMRVLESNSKVYLNAGDSVLVFNQAGQFESQHQLIFPVDDIEQTDIVDIAVSPDGLYLSAISHLTLSTGGHETVWSLQKTSLPSFTEKFYRFGGSFDLYRVEFTAQSDYAIACNPDPTINDDFYLMRMSESGSYTIRALRQAVWGRPMFLDNPQRLLQVYPLSLDDFKTTYNIFDTRELADILADSIVVD